MKFKKFKIIFFIIIAILLLLMIGKTCKKTKALTSGYTTLFSISQRDSGQYGFVCVMDVSNQKNTNNVASYDLFAIYSSGSAVKYYVNITTDSNYLRLYSQNPDTVQQEVAVFNQTRLLQLVIDYDVDSLYLIAYQLIPSYQQQTNIAPSITGFTRTMLFRHNLSSPYDLTNDWVNGDIYIRPIYLTGAWTYNGLINCSYISSGDTPVDTNEWVDRQVLNTVLYNSFYTSAYNLGVSDGYDEGYQIGTSEGEEVGYDNGYTEGYDTGYVYGTNDGYNEGYPQGYDAGYDVGYDAGLEGETAISPAFRVITDIFVSLGSLLAIELVPNVPLGLFFLVPLFFAIVGLILWIWRRN